MNDKTRRPLQIPSWHIPYMEKHRLFELFHELGRELMIQMPEDHVGFIKNILYNAAQNRDNARVVIICPPKSNCDKVAYRISLETKQVIITNTDIEKYTKKKRRELNPTQLAKCIGQLARKENAYKQGWILVNCLKTPDEARALLNAGILPTHAFYIVSPFYPSLDELKYCHVPVGWPEYRRKLIALKDVFKKILVEVHFKSLTPEELAKTFVELINIRKGKIFLTPRVVLIGPRGSGRKTQAKLLVKELNVVHIDFEYLLCQIWIAESDLSTKLRECGDEVCFHSELLVQVLNKRILEDDCLQRGWVLTGFPFCVGDFMYMDCVDTPPNRVIFLDCDPTVCKERVIHNRINTVTGSVVNIAEQQADVKDKDLELHPNYKPNMVDAEHGYYCEQYPKLKNYCGGTANVVNGNQNPRWVHEWILGITVRESQPALPRQPFADVEMPRAPVVLKKDSLCCCGSIPPKVLDLYSSEL